MKKIACIPVVVAALGVSAHSYGDKRVDVSEVQSSQPVVLTLNGEQGVFNVPVIKGVPSIIFLPNDVRHYEVMPESLAPKYIVESSDRRLRVISKGQPKKMRG